MRSRGLALLLALLALLSLALLLGGLRPTSVARIACLAGGAVVGTEARALVDLDGLAPGDARGQRGAGVLLFAYAERPRLLAARLEAATGAARRMKVLDPWLRVAVATNGVPSRGIFDHVLEIEPRHVFDGGDPRTHADGAFRPVESQALTRIYYLARSPFALTLALEGAAVVCRGGVDALLRAQLTSEPAFDLAYSPRVHQGAPHSTTALLVHANAATRALLRDWFVEHLNADPTGDPGPALARALERRLGSSVGWAPAQAGVRLRRAQLDSSFMCSLEELGAGQAGQRPSVAGPRIVSSWPREAGVNGAARLSELR
ncbi:hypothetical protein T492DRAFT_996262 [Pavlovales sp. CCMP2436]|nr:hypothetical protein T492DRAFT_996262 [Pavlovales sp. CCMP2436]